MSVVIEQPALGDELERVADALTQAFTQLREAVLAGQSVIVVLDDRDLLGQGVIADAAVASGMLGLVRAFALEGAGNGWTVNAVTGWHRSPRTAVAMSARDANGLAIVTGAVGGLALRSPSGCMRMAGDCCSSTGQMRSASLRQASATHGRPQALA